MILSTLDLLVISLTVNGCTLIFNLVPKVRTLIAEKGVFRSFKRLRKICRWFEDRPWTLAKIVTDQCLIWSFFLLSFVAMCSTDVIMIPFRFTSETASVSGGTPSSTSGRSGLDFVGVLLAMNLGRYTFCLIQNVFLIKVIGRLRFRAEVLHHIVTITCYAISLSYRQNLLLCLIGIIMEANSTLDEIGRHLKEQEKHCTIQYRRVVTFSCAMTVAFRGIIPLTFLIIAMFHQSPFVMDYAPLTVFFLSIIFFSVINVWLVLTNMQRLIKIYHYGADGSFLSRSSRSLSVLERGPSGTLGPPLTRRFHSGEHGGIRLSSKNNLGYVRPYNNKNLSNNLSDYEKINLNNRKEFSKETLQFQMTKNALAANEKPDLELLLACGVDVAQSSLCSPSGLSEGEGRVSGVRVTPRQQVLALRNSDSSESNSSAIVLISSNDQTTQFSRARRNVPSLPRVHGNVISRRGSTGDLTSFINHSSLASS